MRASVLLLAGVLVVVQGRPQGFGDILSTGGSAISDTFGTVSDGAGQLIQGTLQNAQRFGQEFVGTAGDIVNTGMGTALQVNNAIGDVSVAALGGMRDTIGAVGDFASENVRDGGRLAAGIVRSSVGTAVGVTEIGGRFATDMTGGVLNLFQEAGDAFGQFAGDVVENTVTLARNAGDVVGNLAEGAVQAFTGYDPMS